VSRTMLLKRVLESGGRSENAMKKQKGKNSGGYYIEKMGKYLKWEYSFTKTMSSWVRIKKLK
jgi:hypothetical protein